VLILARPNGDARALGGGRWRAAGPDPQLRLGRLPGGPRFAVVEIEAGDGEPLDAAVYLRGRGGFDEARRIDLPGPRLLLVVSLAGEAAAGVRIDPTDAEGAEFRMRWWTRRTRAGLRRLVAARLADRPGLVPTLIGPDPGLAGLPGGRARLGGGWTEDLGHVWALAAAEARAAPPPEGPTLSFLTPVHDPEPEWLDGLRDSVLAQGPGVELVLSDDGSGRPDVRAWLDAHGPGGARARPGLTVLRAATNRGVAAATNAALAVATGDWVGLIDHDDLLSPFAVDRIRRALAAAPDTLFLYSDEAIVDARGRPVGLYAKPAFDPALLSGVNYVNHLSLYRRDRLAALGGLAEGFQGSQDYELLLRYLGGADGAGVGAGAILHLPYPAYQWRQTPGSLSHARRDAATEAARRALGLHYGRAVGPATVEPATLLPDLHRLRFRDGPRPRVSVVIPNRDSPALIGRVLEDLFERTAHVPVEVIVVDNGTADPATRAIYDRWTAARGLRVDLRPEPFNFARMANRGASLARGDAILLLNNDIAVLEPGWLDEMLECLAYPGTGIVGAKLLYPDRSIQHAGVILGLGDLAGHWFYKDRETEPGPMGRLAVRNGLTVVTGACMLVTRACWEDAGGMDEARFAVAYNDVDFCARARARGHGVIWTPFATLIHDESASRGSDMVGEKARRFRREKQALAERHDTARFEDPAYSPWHARRRSRPRFVRRETLPGGRHFHGFPGGG
jgi:GT2 family glycosyltransferase